MNGSELEFQRIYETFQPKILRYLIRLVGEDEAESLTQEVFIKAGVALPGFRGESSLSTWLYRIATNIAYDRMRSPTFQRTAAKRQCHDPNEENAGDIHQLESIPAKRCPRSISRS